MEEHWWFWRARCSFGKCREKTSVKDWRAYHLCSCLPSLRPRQSPTLWVERHLWVPLRPTWAIAELPTPPQNVSLHCILQVWIRPCSNLGLESPEKESQTFVKNAVIIKNRLGSHPVIIPRHLDSLYHGLSFSAKDLPHLFTGKGYPSLTKIWVFQRHSGQLEPPPSIALSPISSPITPR